MLFTHRTVHRDPPASDCFALLPRPENRSRGLLALREGFEGGVASGEGEAACIRHTFAIFHSTAFLDDPGATVTAGLGLGENMASFAPLCLPPTLVCASTGPPAACREVEEGVEAPLTSWLALFLLYFSAAGGGFAAPCLMGGTMGAAGGGTDGAGAGESRGDVTGLAVGAD